MSWAVLAAAGWLIAGAAVMAQDASPASKPTPAPAPVPYPINRPAPVAGAPATPAPAVVPAIPPRLLVWDSERKTQTVQAGAANAEFVFLLTNTASFPVTISEIHTSCGCTVPKAPPMPWTLAPGTNGQVGINVNLAGKSGTFTKQITVSTTNAPGFPSILYVDITIPENPEAVRARNMQMASADPAAIFKGDCARCHVAPTVGKMDKDLYVAACGICHEAQNRATMVPDLHNLPHPTDYAFWKEIITHGKPRTLMPGFSAPQGGPLSPEQIESLAQLLNKSFPSRTAAVAGTNATLARINFAPQAPLPPLPQPPAVGAPPAPPAPPK